MSLRDRAYIRSLKGAQAFISMDPNLLRFPEVVLERIQIKIEDEVPPSVTTNQEEEQPPGKKDIKDETEWASKDQQTPQNGEESTYNHAGGAAPRLKSGSCGKERRKEAIKAGHRFGYNGSLGDMERGGGGHRRGGKKKRGGWHHLAFRDRQQFQRKLQKHSMMYVEEERQRGQRFSDEENEALVVNVLNHYRELCGHSAIKGSATRKRRLWQEVVNQVNSAGTTYRSIEVCKKRYGDCRRAVKLKMAALEQQALGRGDPHEPIKFNSWEEKLRQKISSLMSGGGQGILDNCDNMLEHGSPMPSEPLSPNFFPSWTPTVDTAAYSVMQQQPPAVLGEAFSEGEEATSPLEVQIVSGEWSEVEESLCPPASQLTNERTDEAPPPAEPHGSSPLRLMDGSQYLTTTVGAAAEEEEPALGNEEEELGRRLRQQSSEMHKLRENVVEGHGRIVRHLEGLTAEVRELNAHVRQIHLNQSHFNHMFQNYLSDTKQFYGAMVQAMKELQQPPATVSPASSPPPSPKPRPPATPPNVVTAMTDYTNLSPAGSAEPASASSTGSELPLYVRRPPSTFHITKNQ